MKRSSANHHQLSTGPLPLNKIEAREADLNKVETVEISSALRDVGRLIEAAREQSGLTRHEICWLLAGPGADKPISDAQYSRWVSGSTGDTLPMWRVLLLTPTFWFHLNQLLNERYGLRRIIAAQLLGVAADLAIASGSR